MCFLSTTFPNAPAHPPILFDQSLSQLLNQSFCQPVRYPTAQSVNQLLNQSFCEPVRHPTPQSQSQSTVSQSVSQSLAQSVILSVRQVPNCTVS